MDLHFSPEDEQFRAELRTWLEENTGRLTDAGSVMKGAGAANIMDAIQMARDWQKTLWEAGYVGLPWPREYGGQDASFTQQVIAAEEFARVSTPPLINTIGLTILGPTLIRHGTEEQRRRFLPRILTAEELWCQGFSEPEAGSDLAALTTRGELDGDEFVVNGQKVWTSLAPIADWCFLLVRSDVEAPKREGISYLLLDMTTPGIQVNPLRNAAGGIHFSEMFLDDVRIPRSNLVGELHGGWQIARTTLEHERSGLSGVLTLEQTLSRLRRTATELTRGDARALDDDTISAEFAQLWIEIEGLRHLGYRTLSAQIAGREPGASASVGKLFASQLRQRIAQLALKVEGPLAAVTKKSPTSSIADGGTPRTSTRSVTASAAARPRSSATPSPSACWGCHVRCRTDMNFELSDEQVALAEATRHFLENRWSAGHMRAAIDQPPARIPDELWKEMAELGWIGIASAVELGGSGGDVLTACVLAEEFGRGLLPGAVSTVLAAAAAIERGGDDELGEVLLPGVFSGDQRVVCAIEEPVGTWGPDAVTAQVLDQGGTWALSGTKILVPDVEGVDQFLVAARTSSTLGFVVVPADAPGITVTPMRRLDAQSIAEVVFDEVTVPPSALLGGLERAESTLRSTYDISTILCAADLLGAAEAALEMATAYAKERVQFDRPIGSFQAVSHRLADLLVEVEIGRSLLYAACLALDEAQPDASMLTSAAKAFIGESAIRATEGALHVHGGIGFTWELDIHLYLRRARAGAVTFGDADFHRGRVARLLARSDCEDQR